MGESKSNWGRRYEKSGQNEPKLIMECMKLCKNLEKAREVSEPSKMA